MHSKCINPHCILRKMHLKCALLRNDLNCTFKSHVAQCTSYCALKEPSLSCIPVKHAKKETHLILTCIMLVWPKEGSPIKVPLRMMPIFCPEINNHNSLLDWNKDMKVGSKRFCGSRTNFSLRIILGLNKIWKEFLIKFSSSKL